MKTNNSILMGTNEKPSNSYGIKLLVVPCLLLLLCLTTFNSKGSQNATVFNDPYVWTTVEIVFTDLDGTEYQDVWVDFWDENHYPVTVYNLTLNYKLSIIPTTYTQNMSQVLSGNSFFLLEDNVVYYIPPGSYSTYYVYDIMPGTGYIPYP